MPSGGDRSKNSPLLEAIREREGDDYYGGDESTRPFQRDTSNLRQGYLVARRVNIAAGRERRREREKNGHQK